MRRRRPHLAVTLTRPAESTRLLHAASVAAARGPAGLEEEEFSCEQGEFEDSDDNCDWEEQTNDAANILDTVAESTRETAHSETQLDNNGVTSAVDAECELKENSTPVCADNGSKDAASA